MIHIILCAPVRGPVSQVSIDNVSSPDTDAAFRQPAHMKCLGYECHNLRVLSVIIIVIIIIVIIIIVIIIIVIVIIVVIVGRGAAASAGSGGWCVMGNHFECRP